jgi:hypothetical protein
LSTFRPQQTESRQGSGSVLETQRDLVIKELTHHCGDGRLTLDELEDRIELAFAATSVDELRALVSDLPGGGTSFQDVEDPIEEPVATWDATPSLPPVPRPSLPPLPRPGHGHHPDKRVGPPDWAKLVSTACGIGGFVLLINGMFWIALLVWFVVPSLLIHDRWK